MSTDDDSPKTQPSGAPTYEAEMARHGGMDPPRGDAARPATTRDKFGNPMPDPIDERTEPLVMAALPYLRTEEASLVLAHPDLASNTLRMAQRSGNLPSELPRISLVQAVLAMRADFDRRIRQHAVPPAESLTGRERFEETAALAALVPELRTLIDALVEVLGQSLSELGFNRNVRRLIEIQLARDQSNHHGKLQP